MKLVNGICSDLTKLILRNSRGSIPICRAAASIMRSIVKIASGRPAPR
jgi:hypothetical protein